MIAGFSLGVGLAQMTIPSSSMPGRKDVLFLVSTSKGKLYKLKSVLRNWGL